MPQSNIWLPTSSKSPSPTHASSVSRTAPCSFAIASPTVNDRDPAPRCYRVHPPLLAACPAHWLYEDPLLRLYESQLRGPAREDSRPDRIKLRFRCRFTPPRGRASAPQCLPNLWRVAEATLGAAAAQNSAPLRIKESAQPDNRLAVRLCCIELKSERWRRSALTLPMVWFRVSLVAANSRRKNKPE